MRYFKGLNALRFFAAILVVLSHASSSLVSHGCYWVYDLSKYSIFQNGSIAVEFFFVLSGFLITSILLQEYEKTSSINIRSFYWKRVVRIWPLYYIIIIIYFVLAPIAIYIMNSSLETHLTFGQLVLYILFLPNVIKLISSQTLLSPLWSIGVEEQFYLIWAPVVKFFKSKLLHILISIIVLKLFLNIVLVNEATLNGSSVSEILIYIINNLKFECMAIGGLGAYFVQRRRTLQCVLFHPVTQVVILTVLAMILFDKPILKNSFTGSWMLNHSTGIIFRSILFLYLILNVSLNKRSLVQLDIPILNKLGDISYGIYMYHITIEIILINFLKSMFTFPNSVLSAILYYGIFLGGTIVLAHFSYHWIEKRFLKLKTILDEPRSKEQINVGIS